MKDLWTWFVEAPFSETRKVRVHDVAKHNKVICEDYGSLCAENDDLDYAKVIRCISRKEEGTTSVYVRL